MHTLAPSIATRRLASTLATHVERAIHHTPLPVGGSDLLTSLAAALSVPTRTTRVGGYPHVDDRQLIHACFRFAEAIGRVPTIPELCFVAHVSEHRLRDAFVGTYGHPPSWFFRKWGLETVRNRLLQSHDGDMTVSRAAFDSGFTHLGRFGGYYRAQYGEYPSETLRRAAIPAG